MPSVARINVTPVKSTRLNHPDAVRIEASGPVGDRLFFFVDEQGKRFSGISKSRLLVVRTAFDASRDLLSFSFSADRELTAPAPGDGDPLIVDFYGRAVSAHVVSGPWTDALTDHFGVPTRLARVDHPGAGTDVQPVTLVSLASVEELGRRGGRARLDAERFRMTFELEGCSPHEEDGWAVGLIRIGEVELRVGLAVPRCVVTTLDPATGVQDFPTLAVIASYRELMPDRDVPFGVYASVERTGTVRVGDAVEPIAISETAVAPADR